MTNDVYNEQGIQRIKVVGMPKPELIFAESDKNNEYNERKCH